MRALPRRWTVDEGLGHPARGPALDRGGSVPTRRTAGCLKKAGGKLCLDEEPRVLLPIEVIMVEAGEEAEHHWPRISNDPETH